MRQVDWIVIAGIVAAITTAVELHRVAGGPRWMRSPWSWALLGLDVAGSAFTFLTLQKGLSLAGLSHDAVALSASVAAGFIGARALQFIVTALRRNAEESSTRVRQHLLNQVAQNCTANQTRWFDEHYGPAGAAAGPAVLEETLIIVVDQRRRRNELTDQEAARIRRTARETLNDPGVDDTMKVRIFLRLLLDHGGPSIGREVVRKWGQQA